MKTPDNKPRAKPVKPRRMYATLNLYTHTLMEFRAVRGPYSRPCIVIDLAPESVEALVYKLALMHTPLKTPSEDNMWAARHQLAALGIKPAGKRGRG